MPIRYVGRTTYEHGKTLWEILCRLRNFGVGRMVYRNRFNSVYTEPSYYIISKVDPDMSDPENSRASNAWGFKVWRGRALGETPITVGFKSDWRLVPRMEEAAFRDKPHEPFDIIIVPEKHPLPPLIQYMIKKENPNAELPLLKLKIKQFPHNRAKLDSELSEETLLSGKS